MNIVGMFGHFKKVSCFITITSYIVYKSVFTLHKVEQQQFIGEMCKSVIFWCQVSSGGCVTKIIKTG